MTIGSFPSIPIHLIATSASLTKFPQLLEARILAFLLSVKLIHIKLVPISGHLHLQFSLLRKIFAQVFASLIHLLQSGLCSDAPTTEKCPQMTLFKITTPTTYTHLHYFQSYCLFSLAFIFHISVKSKDHVVENFCLVQDCSSQA